VYITHNKHKQHSYWEFSRLLWHSVRKQSGLIQSWAPQGQTQREWVALNGPSRHTLGHFGSEMTTDCLTDTNKKQ